MSSSDPAANASPAPVPAASAQATVRAPGPRIVAMMNQKGGVGKTTTTVNLGAALAEAGKRVLFIDLDPQAHLSLHVGVDPDSLERSAYHLLTDPQQGALEVIRNVTARTWVLPAEVNLAGVESELAAQAASGQAQRVLRDKLRQILENGIPSAATDGSPPTLEKLDFVLIDCPPSLGLLTLNALALAREVFVPMQAHFLALQGLSKLLETVNLVKQAVNPDLLVSGIILCMYEGQTLLANEVLADLNSFLDAGRDMDVPWRAARIIQPPIRRNIKLAECPSFGKTIVEYAPQCPGAADYRQLAKSVLNM
ncbi:MAG: ParA family protein [Planctomycetota bacterium]|nr:ParA family protein [Planctomycetota bacterium]